jgi:hypothetical protein
MLPFQFGKEGIHHRVDILRGQNGMPPLEIPTVRGRPVHMNSGLNVK